MQCIGCHPTQPFVTDKKKKTVKLCRKYVENLYLEASAIDEKEGGNLLDKPSKKFDKCGFLGSVPVGKTGVDGAIIPEKVP